MQRNRRGDPIIPSAQPLPLDPFLSGDAFRNLQTHMAGQPIVYDLDGVPLEKLRQVQDRLGTRPVPYDGRLIGDRFVIPAHTTNFIPLAPFGGMEMSRFKVMLSAEDHQGALAPKTGAALQFSIQFTMQNERHPPRQITVNVGDGRIVYGPGTSVLVMVKNLMNIDLTANYSFDAGSHGYSDYYDTLTLTGVSNAGETDVPVVAWCKTFTVLSKFGDPAPTLKGYNAGGVNVYSEVLAAGRSADIVRVPGFTYTITGGGAAQELTVYQYCEG